MNNAKRFFLIFCLALLSALPSSVFASITSQQASDIARQQIPGRVLAVKQVSYQGQQVYQIKILNSRGEVHLILIDAENGKPVGQR